MLLHTAAAAAALHMCNLDAAHAVIAGHSNPLHHDTLSIPRLTWLEAEVIATVSYAILFRLQQSTCDEPVCCRPLLLLAVLAQPLPLTGVSCQATTVRMAGYRGT